MGNLDLKFYWAVFLRRLPYFLVVAALLTAVAVTARLRAAAGLPQPGEHAGRAAADPGRARRDRWCRSTRSSRSQIIEQRLMTRANLLELAQTIGLYADAARADRRRASSATSASSIEFIGFSPTSPRCAASRAPPSSASPSRRRPPQLAYKGANELVNLVLQENVRLRTGRAGDTLEFFQTEVEQLEAGARRPQSQEHRRLQDRQRQGAARQHGRPPRPAGARAAAAARPRARGGVAAQPARHRRLGVRAHRPLGRHRHRSAPRRSSCRR